MATVARLKLKDEEVIQSFPRYEGAGCAGYIVDFLGVKTRTSYIIGLEKEGGALEGYPIPYNFHATAAEWSGVLRAVLDAEKEIVAVELGAGWAPWLVTVARAAQLKGIKSFRLLGVEGSEAHCAYMASHFRDNGIDPEAHAILHGVVGESDGEAEFPPMPDPTAGYGARAVFLPPPPIPDGQRNHGFLFNFRANIRRSIKWIASLGRGASAAHLIGSKNLNNSGSDEGSPNLRVNCFSLPTLLKPFSKVDLLHMDIQGDEYKVVLSARDVLKQKVVRMVIGTHSRAIEQQLLDELAWQSWILESQEACTFLQEGRRMLQTGDGCQVWRNTAFDSVAAAA
jgi:hypothetical protein